MNLEQAKFIDWVLKNKKDIEIKIKFDNDDIINNLADLVIPDYCTLTISDIVICEDDFEEESTVSLKIFEDIKDGMYLFTKNISYENIFFEKRVKVDVEEVEKEYLINQSE